MQPDDSNVGGISDSVISGDVHHHHYAPQPGIVQPQPQPQQIMINPNTGLPQNVIVIQQPSSAPKVVGILLIIFGVLGIGQEVISIGDTLSFGGLFIVLSLVNLAAGAGYITGGVMMTNYQKRGVHLALIVLVVSTIVGVASLTMMPEMLNEVADEQDLTQEERDNLDAYAGTVVGIGAVFLIVCNSACGLIIAIPLMVSNSGLDDSSLFG